MYKQAIVNNLIKIASIASATGGVLGGLGGAYMGLNLNSATDNSTAARLASSSTLGGATGYTLAKKLGLKGKGRLYGALLGAGLNGALGYAADNAKRNDEEGPTMSYRANLTGLSDLLNAAQGAYFGSRLGSSVGKMRDAVKEKRESKNNQ